MTIIVLIFSILMVLYFGVIRLCDKKKKEFLLFLVLYIFALFCMVCLCYIYVREKAGENWHLNIHPIRNQLILSAYYAPPTFVASYLLYPFKTIKRNRILIWVLLAYTLIVVGLTDLISLLAAFSNM